MEVRAYACETPRSLSEAPSRAGGDLIIRALAVSCTCEFSAASPIFGSKVSRAALFSFPNPGPVPVPTPQFLARVDGIRGRSAVAPGPYHRQALSREHYFKSFHPSYNAFSRRSLQFQTAPQNPCHQAIMCEFLPHKSHFLEAV